MHEVYILADHIMCSIIETEWIYIQITYNRNDMSNINKASQPYI